MDDELNRVGVQKDARRGAETHEPDEGSQAEQVYTRFESNNDGPGHHTTSPSYIDVCPV
jgi:hypothetical protein